MPHGQRRQGPPPADRSPAFRTWIRDERHGRRLAQRESTRYGIWELRVRVPYQTPRRSGDYRLREIRSPGYAPSSGPTEVDMKLIGRGRALHGSRRRLHHAANAARWTGESSSWRPDAAAPRSALQCADTAVTSRRPGVGFGSGRSEWNSSSQPGRSTPNRQARPGSSDTPRSDRVIGGCSTSRRLCRR
jgi:hypothetical protein